MRLTVKVSYSIFQNYIFKLKFLLHHYAPCDEIFETISHLEDFLCGTFFELETIFLKAETIVPLI